jgi:hypothetical protein
MGLFFAGARLGSSGRDGLTLTPREFTEFVARAVHTVIGVRDSDTYQPGVADRVRMTTLANLSARVRAYPDDATGHWRLAVAQLSDGKGELGSRHLIIAADLLLRQCADARTLRATLRAHLELKLVGVVLVPVCLRRGMTASVHRLLTEVLLVW